MLNIKISLDSNVVYTDIRKPKLLLYNDYTEYNKHVLEERKAWNVMLSFNYTDENLLSFSSFINEKYAADIVFVIYFNYVFFIDVPGSVLNEINEKNLKINRDITICEFINGKVD
jgi:hypothetical protein